MNPMLPAVDVVDNPVLERVLQRVRSQSDFPALSAAVARVQKLTVSESASVHMLADQILQDVALTHKLLRWVNAAFYSHAGGGDIATISRAVALVGFGGVRNLALSLVLLEHLNNRGQATRLRHAFLRALLAANIAAELASAAQDEEAFLGTLFQDLGLLLVEASLPEEAEQIAQGALPTPLLGVTMAELGVTVARVWGLPESLIQVMQAPDGEAPRRAAPPGIERGRWLGRMAHEAAAALLAAGQGGAKASSVALRYAAVLAVPASEIVQALERARESLPRWAQALGIEGLAPPPKPRAPAPAPVPDAAARTRTVELLTAGVQDLSEVIVQDGARLDDAMRVLIESIYRALQAQRVIVCQREGACLVGRWSFGARADVVQRLFQVPLAAQGSDLFALICHKGSDTLLGDARSGEVASRLPPWYRQEVDAPAMLLMPLVAQQQLVGLIYIDRAAAHSLQPGEKEWALLRTLRNQALMALRVMAR